MKLSYGTHALQGIKPLHAVTEIGCNAIEVNCGKAWPTAPDRLAADARARLRDAIQAAGFPSPPLMNVLQLCAQEENTDEKLRLLEESCRLAADLSFDQ